MTLQPDCNVQMAYGLAPTLLLHNVEMFLCDHAETIIPAHEKILLLLSTDILRGNLFLHLRAAMTLEYNLDV